MEDGLRLEMTMAKEEQGKIGFGNMKIYNSLEKTNNRWNKKSYASDRLVDFQSSFSSPHRHTQ